MDKSIIMDDKIAHGSCVVHGMPSGCQDFHRRYGLWICHAMRKISSPPRSRREPRYFEYYSLSHLLDGKGWLWRKDSDTREEINPGDGVLIAPGFVHDYGGDGAEYAEDAVCFTGAVADGLFQSRVIRNGMLRIGGARRLLPVIELAADPSRNSQLRANIALQSLLVDLHLERVEKDPCPSMDRLVAEIKRAPRRWWTLPEMAEYCRLSEAQFRRVFRKRTGMSPKLYIDSLKMGMAAARLGGAENLLADIAREFGYADVFHFSRRFKQMTGFSPKSYLRQMRKR